MDGPASGEKGSKGRNYLDCILGNEDAASGEGSAIPGGSDS